MGSNTVSLLEDIRNDAVDGSVDLSTVLRKCRVLASRLENAAFRQWVLSELNGYAKDKEVPEYRIAQVDSYGTLSGYGRQLTNAPLSLHNLPDKLARALSTAKFFQGVESLQSLIGTGLKNNGVYSSWPPALIARYAASFYQDMNLISAYKVIPVSLVKGVLSTVRNKVLEFVLQIADEIGDGMGGIPSNRAAKDKVENIVNMVITGDGNRIATNCNDVDQSIMLQVGKGNWDLLSATLTELKISKSDQTDLKKAIEAEPPQGPQKLGGRVSAWLGKVLAKVGTASAAQLIVKGIGYYCGF